jgi:hypothetical protein
LPRKASQIKDPETASDLERNAFDIKWEQLFVLCTKLLLNLLVKRTISYCIRPNYFPRCGIGLTHMGEKKIKNKYYKGKCILLASKSTWKQRRRQIMTQLPGIIIYFQTSYGVCIRRDMSPCSTKKSSVCRVLCFGRRFVDLVVH